MQKLFKITIILISFIFLTGFTPYISLIGPSLTAITSGNIYKAGGQYMITKTIKKKTGKDSFDFVRETIEKNEKKRDINQELRILVEKRINLARQKLNLVNINQ
tara:strand:+ start:167 stop:478 length:312 start_codon:yes stop_codon:yes gene_type:complete